MKKQMALKCDCVVGIDMGIYNLGICKYNCSENKLVHFDVLDLSEGRKTHNSSNAWKLIKNLFNQLPPNYFEGVREVGVETPHSRGKRVFITMFHMLEYHIRYVHSAIKFKSIHAKLKYQPKILQLADINPQEFPLYNYKTRKAGAVSIFLSLEKECFQLCKEQFKKIDDIADAYIICRLLNL